MTKRFAAVLLVLPLLIASPLLSFADQTGPYAISVYAPDEIQAGSAAIKIQVEDVAGIGWQRVTATTTYDGMQYDLTEYLRQYDGVVIEVAGNTEIVVTVTAPDGQTYTDSRSAYLFEDAVSSQVSAPPDRGVGTSEVTTATSQAAANPETGGDNNSRKEEAAPPADPSSTDTSQPEDVDPATGKKTAMEQFPDDAADADDVEPIEPMNTDGTSTIIDNAVVGPQQREFFTFSTPLGNVYYLIVDRNKDSENVYFVNAVTEQDLLDLAEDESWTTDYVSEESSSEADAQPPGDTSEGESESSAAEQPEQEDATEPPPKDGGGSPLIVVGVVLVIALGAGYYFKIVRPKKELDSADDLEDIEYLDEDDGDYAFEDEGAEE